MVMERWCKKDMEEMELVEGLEIMVDKGKNCCVGEKLYEESD